MYTSEQVDKWTEYGFRVWLQKDIGEADKKKFGGRDHALVAKELTAKSIPFTVTDWEKGASSSAEDKALLAMFKGMSKAQIAELLATHKASEHV